MKGKLLLKVYEGNDKVLLYNEKKGKRCLKKESNWVRLYVIYLVNEKKGGFFKEV